MRRAPEPACRVALVPIETAAGCYDWVIRDLDGRRVARSPCAFASRAAARLSGECRRHEMGGGGPASRRPLSPTTSTRPASPRRGASDGRTAADRLRVLIVDDNVFYAEALRSLLERERHEVVGVTDHAAGAMDVARTERPHLALVDLTLCDGCSGPELGCRLARAGVGVLFLTGTPELAPVQEGGVLGVLLKPAGDARLLRAVEAAQDWLNAGGRR